MMIFPYFFNFFGTLDDFHDYIVKDFHDSRFFEDYETMMRVRTTQQLFNYMVFWAFKAIMI